MQWFDNLRSHICHFGVTQRAFTTSCYRDVFVVFKFGIKTNYICHWFKYVIQHLDLDLQARFYQPTPSFEHNKRLSA